MSNDNFVKAKTIGECWINSIKHIINNGNEHYDEDVKIKEILGLSVEIENPKLNDKIIEEFGDSHVITGTLKKFSKGAYMPDKPFTYGACIYDKDGIDQFEWLVKRLKLKKETKSATICLLTPGNEDPNLPCLTTIDVKIRHNKLILQFFFRSQNIFGRQYANLLALVKLQNDLAQRCSVEVGGLKGYVASAHIYEYDFEQARLINNTNEKIIICDKYYTNGPKSIRK